MKYFIPVVLIVLLGVVLAGCGGGGGGTTPTIPLESTTRALLAGDEWQYSLTGTANDGTDTYAITGHYTETISAMTVVIPDLTIAHVVLWSMTLTVNGTTATIVGKNYYTQNAQGTVYTFGGENADGVFYVTSGTFRSYITQPSPVSVGSSWGAHVERTDGRSWDEYYVVTGIDTITVPAGRFEAYRVTGNGYFSDLPASITEWYAPQVGAFVRGDLTATDSDLGVTMTLRLDLTNKNRSVASGPTPVGGDLHQWMQQLRRRH